MDEHRLTIRREPHVGFDPAGAELQRPTERRQRVLGLVGSGAAMSEGDRSGHGVIVTHGTRRDPLSSAFAAVPMGRDKRATTLWEEGPS